MSSTSTITSSPSATTSATATDTPCGSVTNQVDLLGLRIGSLFIIMFTSLLGALFPVLTRRTKIITVPRPVFEFVKYFGSGVIIATAFIHLLSPALDELGSPCLSGVWTSYPWALALCMFSMFTIFFLELTAFRWGSAKLSALGITVPGSHAAPTAERVVEEKGSSSDVEQAVSNADHSGLSDATAQIIGVAILEFGIVLHSILIGLTLAVDPRFKVLFVVIVFHQMFEGLGLGARLAFLPLPSRLNFVPIIGGILYGLTTPIGIAAGLGIRVTYNPNSEKAVIISGIMDALSSGILLYTGLVELLAHEFLFNPALEKTSNKRLVFSCVSMLLGAGLMALLGNWA